MIKVLFICHRNKRTVVLEKSGTAVLSYKGKYSSNAKNPVCHVFARFTGKQRKTTKTKGKLQPKQQK